MHQLNLLSQRARRRQIIHARTRQWLSVIGATSVVLAAYTAWLWHDGGSAASERRALEARYQPLADLQAESIGLRRSINQLQAREHLTLDLATSRPAVALLGAIAQAALDVDAEVMITQVEFDTGPDGHSQLGIHGVGNNSLAIAQFMTALRELPVFAAVEFDRDTPPAPAPTASGDATTVHQTFYTNCKL